MCDTFVALAPATADGSVILGKNSDREPNEAHQIVLVPGASHPRDARVDCTYIESGLPATMRSISANGSAQPVGAFGFGKMMPPLGWR